MNKVTTLVILAMLAIAAGSCSSAEERERTQMENTANEEATSTSEAEAVEAGFAEEVADEFATKTINDADATAAYGTVAADSDATVAAQPTPTLIPCSGAIDCDDFPSDASPQDYWERCGRPALMDRDLDGIVCEGE